MPVYAMSWDEEGGTEVDIPIVRSKWTRMGCTCEFLRLDRGDNQSCLDTAECMLSLIIPTQICTPNQQFAA